jgi:uncharacterized membrane protein YoaK (UPF0700 family)
MPIKKLPVWIELGGFSLAFIAGSVNAVGLMGFSHQAVSHLTGTSTFLSLQIASGQWSEVWHLCLILLSFVAGATVSGIIVQNMTLKMGKRYGFVLLLESVLLCCAMISLNRGLVLGHLLASAACGLQNAMMSTFSGATIRTTHVSGLFTDLGILIGQRIRGQKIELRRVLLYLILIFGFIAGGILGSFVYLQFKFLALIVPTLLSLLLAISYWFFLYVQLVKSDNE